MKYLYNLTFPYPHPTLPSPPLPTLPTLTGAPAEIFIMGKAGPKVPLIRRKNATTYRKILTHIENIYFYFILQKKGGGGAGCGGRERPPPPPH